MPVIRLGRVPAAPADMPCNLENRRDQSVYVALPRPAHRRERMAQPLPNADQLRRFRRHLRHSMHPLMYCNALPYSILPDVGSPRERALLRVREPLVTDRRDGVRLKDREYKNAVDRQPMIPVPVELIIDRANDCSKAFHEDLRSRSIYGVGKCAATPIHQLDQRRRPTDESFPHKHSLRLR